MNVTIFSTHDITGLPTPDPPYVPLPYPHLPPLAFTFAFLMQLTVKFQMKWALKCLYQFLFKRKPKNAVFRQNRLYKYRCLVTMATEYDIWTQISQGFTYLALHGIYHKKYKDMTNAM